jgi:predicted RNase H-like nuclease (RuvC/YqgF family)
MELPRTSTREELMGRLVGEQARIAELTGKINDMYRLQEEQRLKAREYAHAKDRLEAVRDSLEEELKNVQLSKSELEHQNEVSMLSSLSPMYKRFKVFFTLIFYACAGQRPKDSGSGGGTQGYYV